MKRNPRLIVLERADENEKWWQWLWVFVQSFIEGNRSLPSRGDDANVSRRSALQRTDWKLPVDFEATRRKFGVNQRSNLVRFSLNERHYWLRFTGWRASLMISSFSILPITSVMSTGNCANILSGKTSQEVEPEIESVLQTLNHPFGCTCFS